MAKKPDQLPRRVVRLKPPNYQPTPEELAEPVTLPEGATEEALKALLTPVTVVYDD